jgi:hypothetical protein
MYRYNAQGQKIQVENYEPPKAVLGMDTDEDKAKWAAIIISVVIVLGIGGYFLYKKFTGKEMFSSSSGGSSSSLEAPGMDDSSQPMAFRFY